MGEMTNAQLTHEVDALTEKVRQMENLLGLFMVNGLADAFDGTGNQTYGGGTSRLDATGLQVAMGTGNTQRGIRFFESFQDRATAEAGGVQPSLAFVSKWNASALNTYLTAISNGSWNSVINLATDSNGSAVYLITGADGSIAMHSGSSGDYIEFFGRMVPSALTPAQITADQNNYAPTGYSSHSVLRLSSDAARTITGLTSTFGGIVFIVNVGAQNIILADESASSLAGYRFALSAAVTLAPDEGVTLLYDATSQRWRVVGR